MNSFANILFSFDQRREILIMEHVQVVVCVRHCNYILSCFQLFEFHFFYLAALINYETKDYKENHQIPPSCITRRKVSAVTLRLSATGERYKSLIYQYRVHGVSISRFAPEVYQVIIETFMEEYMSLPDSREKWLSVAKAFEEKCLGGIDGKHVPLIDPLNSGSTYFNYKSFFSIVPLALVEADYRFCILMQDVRVV